ncbi:MAG: class IV adenylate cyclase [Anaerolineae bacterium]
MAHINIEIKARSSRHAEIRGILQAHKARFAGLDHQVDTYFKVNSGRLKLREGQIENALIYYRREDTAGPKLAEVLLYRANPAADLKAILSLALGILVVVDKQREIYFIDNVKFHLDTVANLGTFAEIEAIDADGSIGEPLLRQQCQRYLELFGINPADLVSCSYSDLLLGKT